MKSLKYTKQIHGQNWHPNVSHPLAKTVKKVLFLAGPVTQIPYALWDWNIFLLVTNNKKPKSKPNVGKYSMHGAFGDEEQAFFGWVFVLQML